MRPQKEAISMDFHFKNDEEYLLFRDTFRHYFYKKSNPFFAYFENKMDRGLQRASYYIGEAHYSQFVSKLKDLKLTSLANEEISSVKTIVYEMNVAIIRDEIEKGYSSHDCFTRREVKRHEALFTCVYHRKEECSVSLPDVYEPLLKRILEFQDAVLRYDVKALVQFLEDHYQGLDRSWAEERLTFLKTYFAANANLNQHQEFLLGHRGQKQ